MNWASILITVLGSVLSGGGVVAAIHALAGRRNQRVDAAAHLNESTFRWADEMRRDIERLSQDAKEARHEAADARREAADVRREMSMVRREFDELATHLLNVKQLLAEPTATTNPELTIGRLQAIVSGIRFEDWGANGTGWRRLPQQ